MTDSAALLLFFSSFGIDAYPATSVPLKAGYPYLTYDDVKGFLETGETSLAVNLWYRTESEALPNAKANEIAQAIKSGRGVLKCDDGYIWLKIGSPWCQSLEDPNDTSIKRRLINITREDLRY